MTRARETAKLAQLGDVLEVTDDLVELGYGDYEGLTTAEIRVYRPGWDLWRTAHRTASRSPTPPRASTA